VRREGECRATLSHIYPHYPIYVHIIPHMALHSLHMTGLAIPLARGLGISTLSHICPHYPTYGLTYDRARHSVCTRFRPLHMVALSHICLHYPTYGRVRHSACTRTTARCFCQGSPWEDTFSFSWCRCWALRRSFVRCCPWHGE